MYVKFGYYLVMMVYKLEFIRDINEYNYYDILTRYLNYSINFVIIGSETHLVGGLVDVLEANNIICFGPNKKLAKYRVQK